MNKKAGRPKAIIDWNKVGQMLEAHCSAEGIAATMGIDRDTLYLRCKADNKIEFSAFAQEKKAKGKELLRTKQFQTAMSGNVTMQIWLGKQYLDQRDKNELMGKDGDKLQVEHSGAVKQVHAIDGDTADTIFDILATVGAI